MKTSTITVSLNTSGSRCVYQGRGYFNYPFVIHRPQSGDGKLETSSQWWVITHLASGKMVLRSRTLDDSQKVIAILKKYTVFLMPECDKFYKICASQGGKIMGSVEEAGFDRSAGRFV